jgi:hypothetical protein
VTVVGDKPDLRAKSRTPQPSAVRAMRTCNRVIMRSPERQNPLDKRGLY